MSNSPSNKLLAGLAIAVVIIASTTSVAVVAGFSDGKVGPGRGRVGTGSLGIYRDEACRNVAVAVNWGMVSPGTSENVTLYVRNLGKSTMKLSMTTLKWKPTDAHTYITLTWNREGQTLNPQEVSTATLTLSISANITGIAGFSFNTIIEGIVQ